MHSVAVARKAFLGALVALAVLVSTMFVATPKASAGWEQCPYGAMCAWQAVSYGGNFSYWWEINTGCKNHSGNPEIRSAWNRTRYWVRMGGGGWLAPGEADDTIVPPITGDICWGPGIS